jgi:glycosyltransferase involved in cell wall biosynthesis
MANILHIFFSLTVGGAARTSIATAHRCAQLGPYRPSLAVLSLQDTDPRAIEFALRHGFSVPPIKSRADLFAAMSEADIVQVNWWQSPLMDDFLRSEMPPCRLLGWFHCAGKFAPQRVTEELVDLMDRAVAGSPFTYEQDAFVTLSPEERRARTALVNGGADFERLGTVAPRAHDRFTVSYVGTVSPTKMHPEFVNMSAAIPVPGLRVTVCGGPGAPALKQAASEFPPEIAARFDIRGYVEDVAPVFAETDVFGYPLCEDTYAASELVLQEAQYAGIPAVVFPHGGLSRLVIDGYNGIVVRSSVEYAEAIAYLYHNPSERLRLGENAKHFAHQMFGVDRAAPRMVKIYEELLTEPKRTRSFGSLRQSVSFPSALPHDRFLGAERFIVSGGGTLPDYFTSYTSDSFSDLLASESKIQHASSLMRLAGVLPYQGFFPHDPFLRLWAGLVEFGARNYDLACNFFSSVLNAPLGTHSWRTLYYLLVAARKGQFHDVARGAQEALQVACPEHEQLLAQCALPEEFSAPQE